MRTLSLQTPPVAVKYIRDWSEEEEWELADKGYYRPKAPLNVCQFVGPGPPPPQEGRRHRRGPSLQHRRTRHRGSPLRRVDGTRGDREEGRRQKDPRALRGHVPNPTEAQFGEIKAMAFAPLEKMEDDPRPGHSLRQPPPGPQSSSRLRLR